MNTLFETIRQEQPKLPGWCSLEKAVTLASLVVGLRPPVTVEIGIYGGSSLIPILLAHTWIKTGVVYGIEPWDREAAMKAQTTAADVEWWGRQDYDKLYADFIGTVKRLKVEECLRLVRKRSQQVDPMPGIGLLHIDGSHDNQAIHDVVKFSPHVLLGGIVVMDDLQWHGGAVGRAAQRLIQLGYRQLYALGTGAVYQKTR